MDQGGLKKLNPISWIMTLLFALLFKKVVQEAKPISTRKNQT